jgi:hypothetical protein
MEIQPEQPMLFKVIRCDDLDSAHDLARTLSRKGKQKDYPEDEDGPYLWLGVRWAAAVEYKNSSGAPRYAVIASIRAPEQPFEEWAAHFEEQSADPAAGNQDYAVEQYYKGGRPTSAAHDGMP